MNSGLSLVEYQGRRDLSTSLSEWSLRQLQHLGKLPGRLLHHHKKRASYLPQQGTTRDRHRHPPTLLALGSLRPRLCAPNHSALRHSDAGPGAENRASVAMVGNPCSPERRL